MFKCSEDNGRRYQWMPSRRAALGAGLGLLAAPRLVLAQDDPKRERPHEGDSLAKIGAADPAPLKVTDIPLGGPQMLVWPIDPANKTARDGTRLNKVLLLRLDPTGFDAKTRERAADSVVAYAAICTHAGCEVSKWLPEAQRLECRAIFRNTTRRQGPRW